MFTMILLLYLQQHRDVTLESSSLRGEFESRKACEKAAVRLRGPLPTPDGYAAAWHDVLCVPIDRNVKVNGGKAVELGRLLQDRPPVVCESTGAWRRVSELCAVKAAVNEQDGEHPPKLPDRQAGKQPTPGGKQG